MEQNIQAVIDLVNANTTFSAEEKAAIINKLKEADKKITITEFKLDRTEKVKRTTAILLEETIEELEQKRKTVETQNHELHIETALERVRTVAMAMKSRDEMLEICKTIAKQLSLLDVKEIRNVQTAIFHPEEGTYMNYEYYSKHDKTIITETSFTNHEMHRSFADQMLKGSGEFFSTSMPKEELTDWIAYQKTTNVFIDEYILTASSLNYYWYSLGEVALGISTYEPLTENGIGLFKRFLKVFELAYRRYLDIEKAEAQAKEARLETALERVRAVAMAMKQSDELITVCEVMFKELLSLGFSNIRNAQLAIENDTRQSYFFYVYSDFEKIIGGEARYESSPIVQRLYNELGKSGDGLYEREYSPEEMIEWRRWRNSLSPLLDEREATVKSLCWYMYSIGKGHIGISTFNTITKEQVEVVKRFRKVFELSYTRFDDLQKAEAQAKEAQIEVALERVRSKAMAMHKSDDLQGAVAVVFEELNKLNLGVLRVGISVLNKEERTGHVWLTSVDESKTVEVYGNESFDTHPLMQGSMDAWINQHDFYYVLEGEDLTNYYKAIQSEDFNLPASQMLSSGNENRKQSCYVAVYNAGGVFAFRENEFPAEAKAVMKRFAGVFDLTYKRFLDLQRAEQQAREAEIELALEKVRARTMAMQHSDELAEASFLLDSQVRALGIKTRGCAFNIYGDNESTEWFSSEMGTMPTYKTPREGLFLRNYEAGLSGKPMHIETFAGEACKAHYEYLCTIPVMGDALKAMIAAGGSFPTQQTDHAVYFKYGYLLFITLEPVPEAHDVFIRFAKVFEQTYTRFLDLQKAEAQARENQVQLALERVRARTMAMQKSAELADVATLLFKQVNDLGIKVWTTGFNVWSDDNNLYQDYITSPQGGFVETYTIDSRTFSVFTEVSDAKKNGKDFYVQYVEGDLLKETYQRLNEFADKGQFQSILESGFEFPSHQYDHFVFGAKASLMFITYEPVPEAHEIFKRFGKAFDQTYTRFLDLQKAEEQAREAQIELGLERVRAKAMATQNSDELNEIVAILFEELTRLDLVLARCIIWIFDATTMASRLWMANSEDRRSAESFYIKPLDHPYYKAILDGWKRRAVKWSYELAGEEKKLIDHLLLNETELSHLSPAVKEGIQHATHASISGSFGNFGMIEASGPIALSNEQAEILARFTKEFERAYTRFLDLQKAEAQAKESQVQLALERVRARTMAMQKSDELQEAASVMFQQLQSLGISSWSCGYNIFEKDDEVCTSFMSNHGQMQPPFILPLKGHETFVRFKTSKQKGEEFWVEELQGKELKTHYTYLFSLPGLDAISEENRKHGLSFPSHQFNHVVNFEQGNLMFITYEPVPEAHDIFKRFGKTFEQTYTRFLDLQRAETQAREAQVEAALERVRAAAMSMMTSRQLLDVCESIYNQLLQLGFPNLRCAQIYILDDEKQSFLNYEYADSFKARIIEIDYNIHPKIISFVRDIKITGAQLIEIFIPEREMDEWRTFLYGDLNQTKEPLLEQAKELYYNHYAIDNGALSISTYSKITAEQKLILERLRNVFGLSYKRYRDLAQAEAQVREAQIEAALERVRSRTLAMQKSDELAETSAVLFQQLIGLGISPNRLYISIMKDDDGNTEFWITDEDGTKVSMAYEDNLNNNPSFKKMLDGWKQQQKSLVIDAKGEELQEYFNHLNSIHVPFKGGLTQKRRLQYIAYFSKGFIGMASPDEQPAETVQLLERFAYVFNLTFTRFNDLQIAEAHALQAEQDLIEIKAARKKAEDTLDELQATQKQLIQSEKMASLGELTAGIAHEIQNPLNFVNNFSEVSKELIDEMRTALENGDKEEAEAIANDIIQNLEKINHHGKRADAIVKGMLQHSRKTEGTKELTDINALADECLRLSYHGLRAKDKSFNAVLKTDFDEGIGKLNVIPQDIGRVLLNIFNNAFYAVNEKNKHKPTAYDPKVSIKTKAVKSPLGDLGVIITLTDNGNGIPSSIIDKIFQPFFTTKPTGQGTGLGLSLAYDIIKAHGGELKVNTKEGEGSVFTIELPIN